MKSSKNVAQWKSKGLPKQQFSSVTFEQLERIHLKAPNLEQLEVRFLWLDDEKWQQMDQQQSNIISAQKNAVVETRI